jgi:DNA-binding transcriptional MerR regulator
MQRMKKLEFSTLQVAREIGVHRCTLLRWLQRGAIPEPRHIRAAGQDIRVWLPNDVERARRLKTSSQRRVPEQ